MTFRFRVWMTAVALLIVLLSILTILLYGFQATRARLAGYVEDRAVARAAAAASAIGGVERGGLSEALSLAAETGDGEILFVGRDGNVVARQGESGLDRLPQKVREAASSGERLNTEIRGHRVAAVPVLREGGLAGSAVFVAGEAEEDVLDIFSRSNVEAAALASVLGGGLMLLVATLLSRRVEKLTLGARAVERGELSSRIEPGYGDELGELADTFNAMAARLEDSFRRIEEGRITLDAILNNLSEGVLATNLSGKPMFSNRVARSVLGIGEGPLPEKLPDAPWPEFDLAKQVARCAEAEECPEARVSDGEGHYQVNLNHMPAFDDHRGGVLVVIRDLSEDRRLEARQQRFLANAAHELKTPITTILGASELLLTEEEDDPELRDRFLRHISAEAERMRRLSDTLLTLARTGLDQRDPEIEAVDTLSVAKEAAERVRPLAGRAGIEVEVEGEGGGVLADREWLAQVLLVLLDNAARHSEKGGVIRLRAGAGRIAVEDEGEGIAAAELPHVFERSYRGGGGTGGFGLGLPICKELLERMEGEIRIKSQQDVGTKVEVRLPEVRDG